MELSYERDSRWRPHLSWNFSSCSLEEQAAQRELAWQRLTDRLGTPILDGGGYKTFAPINNCKTTGRGNPLSSNFHNNQVHLECSAEDQEEEEKHQQSQQQPIEYQHHKKEKYSLSIPAGVANLLHPNLMINNKPSNHHHYTNIPDDEPDYYEHYKKAKRRCLTVSTVLVFLTLLLFTIVILMAVGIVHR